MVQIKHRLYKIGGVNLNTQSELDTDINITSQLDDLGELDRLLGGALQVLDTEDLEARVVNLVFILAKMYYRNCH